MKAFHYDIPGYRGNEKVLKVSRVKKNISGIRMALGFLTRTLNARKPAKF